MTYKAKLWDYDNAAAELAYLSSVNPKAPGAAFNHDSLCFARYANMQANHMLASGFPLMAHDATQYRDIACPEFRAAARDAGHYVSGPWATKNFDAWIDICSTGR